ncbi:MAG: UDP-N-acetylmuramoyl-L-alanine--D-glutamate ligase [Crocinitomicaceae bacterium]|nr:UDP-N-acetylmuramoyl-L-alanine--D-glutamate ligase [Crocinitomicaceae bacterium]
MISEKEITVLGAAKSGIGAAVLAKKEGLNVFVSDYGEIKQEYKQLLNSLNIDWEENGHSQNRILKSVEVVKSPGISNDVKIIKDLITNNIPVISEIEFAGRYSKGKKICVTGSNGKTTTTLMIKHILSKAGLDVVAVGNVGNSFAQVLSEGDHDYYVIELSSFQLDNMYEFKADISVLLNITPDHLDRYDNDFNKYIQSKFRILNNQSEHQVFIYNADDQVIQNEIQKRKIAPKQLPFSIENQLEQGASLNKNQIQINIKTKETIMSIHELAQQGKHNTYNSMASGIASRVLDIRKEIIRESLSDFQNVEHRLEFVAKIHGIDFINDSKATNVNSTWYALESMQKPTIWIVGGVDKGNDYSMLEGLVKQKVVGIVCLGKSNRKIHRSFGSIVDNIHDSNSAQEAVRISYQLAKKGYAVLLSPACASFDLFEDYEERGTKFKRAVRNL